MAVDFTNSNTANNIIMLLKIGGCISFLSKKTIEVIILPFIKAQNILKLLIHPPPVCRILDIPGKVIVE